MDLLAELHRAGHTVVVITHDPVVAARADRRITITDGRVAEDLDQAVAATAGDPSAPTRHGIAPATPSRQGATPLESRQGKLASWADTALDAVSALSSRPMRTLLLILAFAIGVAGLVTSSGLSQSAAAQVSNRLTAAALDEVRVSIPTAATSAALAKDIVAINKLSHVQNAGYYGVVVASDVHVSRTGPFDAEPAESISVATASTSFPSVADLAVTPVHASALLDAPGITRVAIASTRAAAALGIATSAAGPAPGVTIWINSVRVSVIGTFEPGDRSQDLTTSVLVSDDVLASGTRPGFAVVVRTDPGFPATVAKAIPLAVDPVNPGSVTTQTVADLQGLRIGVADDLSVFVAVLASLLLALAAVSGATAMYLSVHARTAEIALRRAIGASRTSIAAMFVGEGVIVGFAGGVSGAAAGLAGVLAIARLRGWTPVLPSDAWSLGIVVGIATALVSAAYPAWLAARQDPAQAIRT